MSQSAPLALNPQARCHVLKIGHEQTRVLLIDNAFQHIDAVQEMAAAQTYTPENATYYPGVRAPCPTGLRDAMLAVSTGLIRQAYQLSSHQRLADQGSWLSLAATPPEQLHPLQCVPHFDSQHSTDFAIMLYVNDGGYQGTGFYRHNPTGFENITPSRWPGFEASRRAYESEFGRRKQDYFASSNDEYTLMGKIDYMPNRMVIYPGTLLHSGLVDSNADLSTNPTSGRLTVNVFAGANV